MTSTITYGEIAGRLEKDLNLGGRIFPTRIGEVAGALMDHLLALDEDIPLINVLVVKQGKELPGHGADGYLRKRFGVSGNPQRRLPLGLKTELVSKAAQEVYAYPHWKEMYERAFGNGSSAKH